MIDIPNKVKEWIGQPVVILDHIVLIEQGMWTNFCIAIEDGNLLYWDYPTSRFETDSVIAPPMMLPSWAIAHDWTPNQKEPAPRTLELHFMVKDALGYKSGLVTEVEMELHEPLHAGESVRAEQILKSVGEERETKLGRGRDWEIEVVYRKPGGQLAGIQTLYLLGYGSLDK